MADYIFELPIGTTGNNFYANIYKQFQSYDGIVTEDEEYLEDPVFFFSQAAHGQYDLYTRCMGTSITTAGASQFEYRLAISIEHIQSVNYIRVYNGESTSYDSGATFSGREGGGNVPDFDPSNPFSNASQLPVGGYGSWASYQYDNVSEWILCTNIPIFETDTEAFAYIGGASNLHRAVNYGYPQILESEDFLVNNVWTTGTWSDNGLSNQGVINYRMLRGKIVEGGKMSFYKIPGINDNKLKYGIHVSGTLTALEYSDDGVTWHDSQSMPYTFFYREHDDEKGTFGFGLSFYSQIPVFEDEATSEKYIDDDPSVSIEDAINWPQISNDYPIGNQTGSDLPHTRMGEVKVKGFFSQQYVMDDTCLTALANDFFDTDSAQNIWELIKKGLDMYPNYMDAVMGLSFWPFSLTSYLKAGSYSPASYVWLGGYGWDTTGHGTCNKIIYPNGEISIGQFRCIPRFKSWRDFEPYCKMYVSLPYCGTYQLDISRYLNKLIKVKYYIDTRVNSCVCCLFADDYLVDFFNGQMGCTLPITMTDYSRFMNSQIETLLGGGGQAVQTFGSGLEMAKTAGSAAGLLGAGATVGVAGAITGAKTVYGLTQNNINNFHKTKGGSSSMINCYLSQNVDFIFEYQISNYETTSGKSVVATPEYNKYIDMFGLPSMKAGTVGSFTGFLKCQSVKVNAPKATEREKEKIKQMLLSGVYI